MKYSIVIIDDHVLIANALRSIISNFPQFNVLYVYGSGIEFIDKVKGRQVPDIIITFGRHRNRLLPLIMNINDLP